MAREGLPEDRDWTYVRKDGTRLPVRLLVTPMAGVNGEIIGLLGIARDVTERKAAEAEGTGPGGQARAIQ